MSDFTPEQLELMRKYRLNPDNYRVLSENSKQLVLLNKRGHRRTLNKEVHDNDA